jgi:hypothetical protein
LLRIREAKQEIMYNNNFPGIEVDFYEKHHIKIKKEHSIIEMAGYEEAEEAEVAKEETEEWNIKRIVIKLLLFLTSKS